MCPVTGDDCYDVEAIPSEDMNKLQAIGNLVLKVSPDEIKLAQACSLVMVASWPLTSLRRYLSEDGVFTIEMGRRSPRGQGLYSFKTARDSELFDKVQLLINKAANAPQNIVYKDDVGTSATSSLGFDIDSRPPAPLPLTKYLPPLPPKDNALDDVDSGGIRLAYNKVTKVKVQHNQQVSLVKVSKFIA